MSKASAKATAETVADTVTETAAAAVETVADERVDIFVPKGNSGDDQNLLVSINGKNYLLPRGKTSKVPPEVAYEIRRSWRAVQLQDEGREELLKGGE